MVEFKVKARKELFEFEEILHDKEVKKFGDGSAHITMPKKHVGKKAVVGIKK